MATLMQKKAIKNFLDNGSRSVSQAMRKAGYSEASSKNPKILTTSTAWAELMDEHFPDENIAVVIEEGLQATRVISAVNTSKQANGGTTDFIDVPDHAVRHKFAETALKLKNKFPAEKKDITSGGKPIPILNGLSNVSSDNSNEETS